MSRDELGALAGSVRLLWQVGSLTGLSDARLLERSAEGGPAAQLALAALVDRHGPMVLRVCRRLLRDPHDAHDAFQATFLVLARRARSIRRPESLPGWLHGVALRVSRSLRASAARRRQHERRAARGFHLATAEPAGEPDLPAVLHEELGRLPERFRCAVVLCDLEGLTHEQAAGRLGCPVGTVKSRLSAARGRLRRRLASRGLAPGAGAIAAALAAEAAGASPSIPLLDSTVRAATAVAARGPAAAVGAVPTAVTALAQEVSHAMILSKLKAAAAAGATLIAATIALAQSPAARPGPAAPPDRLDQLERKIDRLLRALEGAGTARLGEAVVTEADPVKPTLTTPAAAPVGDPPGLAAPVLATTAGPFAGGLPAMPPRTLAPAAGLPVPSPNAAPSMALEQWLARLEQRVDRLEKLIERADPAPTAGPTREASP